MSFIRQMPFFVETDNYIFVHAGVDLTLKDWHETSDYQKVWIREPFLQGLNQIGKIIVFGHTPTFYLFSETPGTSRLWQTQDQKIGMDGGAVYGGVLHGVLFGDEGILKHYFVKNNNLVGEDE